MKYTVEILPRAIAELRSTVLWWAEHRSTEQTGRRMLRIEAAIAGLADHPERHPPAIEGDRFSFEVREMHVGLNRSKTHRVLFAIRDDVVRIYSVRHLAQDFLTAEEIGLH
jgi:plasmid stabilization system protein ParE